MTLPTHRVSYEVEYGILDKAVNDEVGARIKLPSLDAALHLRARIHQARKIDRVENRNAFDEGHPMHGQSIYDKLVLRIKQLNGKAYLYVEQRSAENLEIETLSEPEQPPMEVHEVIVTERIKRRSF